MEVFHSLIPQRDSGTWQLYSIASVTERTVGAWVWTDFAYLVIQVFPWGVSHSMKHAANSL